MSSTELPKLFKYIHEVEGRPNFDSNCGITLDNFKLLVGEYYFSDEVICQVRKSGGNCGHKHRHGWVGVTKDGKEGLIGGHCAAKYFNADKSFASERNRVRREISINSSLETLNQILSTESNYIQLLETEICRIKDIRDSVKKTEAELPISIRKILSDMAKTGNKSVTIQIQYIEMDDKGNKHIEWIDQKIGNISGSAIWLYSNIGSIFTSLKEIKKALHEVELKRESGERELKKWVNTLSGLSGQTEKIEALKNEFQAFTQFNNLSLLIFLVPNQKEQLQLAATALKFNGIRTPSNSQARALIKEMENEIRKNNGNRNFRVPR